MLGLDSAIITFIARSEAVGDRARSRMLFRLAVLLGLGQSLITAGIVIAAIRLFNHRLRLQPEMVSALAVLLCAMPGVALYRISTSVSRGMKIMQHDIYSRGVTEPIVTTLAFLLALAVIDDLIAILFIALFFTDHMEPVPLLLAIPAVLLFGWLSYRDGGWVRRTRTSAA